MDSLCPETRGQFEARGMFEFWNKNSWIKSKKMKEKIQEARWNFFWSFQSFTPTSAHSRSWRGECLDCSEDSNFFQQTRGLVWLSLTKRRVKQKFSVGGEGNPSLKHSLAQRLRKTVEATTNSGKPPKKVHVSKSQGAFRQVSWSKHGGESAESVTKVGEIHVKTLEEIL